ncbi:MAG: amidohydrolase family protein [Planctomycetota bacterium]
MNAPALRTARLSAALTALLGTASLAQEPAVDAPTSRLLRAAKVLTMAGPPIERGEVHVVGRRIHAVGQDLPVPEGTEIVDFGDEMLLPGFVELHCHVGVTGGDINDSALPHNMDLRTLDLVMQDNRELQHAADAGVTTALIIPGSGSSIGGLGTLVKTAGVSMEERLIRYPGALKIALHARGGNPSRAAGDLGRGRLGLHYMLKVVMAEARDDFLAHQAYERGEGPKPKHNPRLVPLHGLFRGEFPVLLHAYGQNDTMSAVRILKWGLDLPIVISHGMYESFKVKAELAATRVPMNLGPRQYEMYDGAFIGNAAELHGAGVPVSICTDAPVIDQDQLPLQAAMAVRLGLPSDAALRGLTIEPARAVFADDRVGSLEPGKDADLIAVAGDPIDPRQRPTFVMIDGRPIVDRQRRLRSTK